jgi:hypothetical protein
MNLHPKFIASLLVSTGPLLAYLTAPLLATRNKLRERSRALLQEGEGNLPTFSKKLSGKVPRSQEYPSDAEINKHGLRVIQRSI